MMHPKSLKTDHEKTAWALGVALGCVLSAAILLVGLFIVVIA